MSLLPLPLFPRIVGGVCIVEDIGACIFALIFVCIVAGVVVGIFVGVCIVAVV